MNTTLSVFEQNQHQMISDGLLAADRLINKSYLINLINSKVLPLDENKKTTSPIRLCKIEKLVFDKEENINDKLISVYSSLLNINSTALLIIKGNKEEVSFYIGVRSDTNAAVAELILEKSFLGNFAGSSLKRLRNTDIANVMNISSDNTSNSSKNISCVTVVPSMRDEDKKQFVQGIEKFIDTMQGECYTAVCIAQPLSKENLEIRKRSLEEMYSALSPYAKTTLTYGDNYSKAVTAGMSESFTQGINNSISTSNGINKSTSASNNTGLNVGIMGSGFNTGHSKSYTTGTSWTNSVTKGTSNSTSQSTNSSESETNGTSRTLSSEHQNKSVAILLEKIDQQLKRFKDCEGFGIWECASYFIADDVQTSVVAANTYKALMLGDNTSVENSYVNVWGPQANIEKDAVIEYIKYGIHPIFEIQSNHGYTSQIVTPGNYISGKELPLLVGIPHKSVAGIPIISTAEFGRNVFVQNSRQNSKKMRLGRVHHMGRTEFEPVELDLNSFTSHCFITGSTGSGKSNTVYCLLENFMHNNIPFLVIEPAKGEYKDEFGGVENINIFTTSPSVGRLLKLNPFSFNQNIHILEHLDRLIEIFNACWEMYAAMPAILKDAIEKIYINKGWDLLNSVYRGDGEPTFPTFDDLMQVLPQIINNSEYSADTKGDYVGALVTRVSSLTNGISGQIFCDCYDIPDTTLFDENTIIDLSRVGSSETKSLIMGILVLKLSEYRMATANSANSGLRHIIVLEEAHNLLKKSTHESAGSNVVGKSVEMICNSIAEMRTYGEGFIIVDQSPTAVDIAAIKNTNTKIVMRLPEKSDCDVAGNAVGLDENQMKELSRLETGVAVVMQNNWLQAVLTHIDAFSGSYYCKVPSVSYDSVRHLRGAAIRELMDQYIVERQMNLEKLHGVIDSIEIAPHKKQEMKCCLQQVFNRLDKGRDIDFFCETLLNVSGAKSLFDIIQSTVIKINDGEKDTYTVDSVKEWQERFYSGIKKYIDLPDEYVYTILPYLLYVEEERQKNVDYYEIQRLIDQEIM